MHRGLDGRRAIDDAVEFDRRWHRGEYVWQQSVDARHGVDDVGARLFVDQQEDAGFAILPGRKLRILRAINGDADIAYAYRRAILVGDDDVVPGSRLQQLIVVIDGKAVIRAIDRAFWGIDGRRRNPRAGCRAQQSSPGRPAHAPPASAVRR